ncbi:MAG: RHS repeat-associated core domain-containing protein, partial [Bryobacteraceae bacterium]
GNVAKRFDYLPFGEEIFAGAGGRTATEGYLSATDPLNPKFTGKVRDNETGLDFMEARYFSSAEGRFTIPDWSAKEEPVPYAKLEDPQSLNLYTYVRNNPLSRFDPDGHCDSGGHADLQGPCPQLPPTLLPGSRPMPPVSDPGGHCIGCKGPNPGGGSPDWTPFGPGNNNTQDPDHILNPQGSTVLYAASGQGGGQDKGERRHTSKPDKPWKHAKPSKEHPGQWEVRDPHTGQWKLKPPGWKPVAFGILGGATGAMLWEAGQALLDIGAGAAEAASGFIVIVTPPKRDNGPVEM